MEVACIAPPFFEVIMNNEDFSKLIQLEDSASYALLSHKAEEYSGPEDRLENFKQAAGMLSINPAEALMGMLVKHFVSVGKMSRIPNIYSMEKWDEKLRDIRNYTYLLKAVLIDIGISYKVCKTCHPANERSTIPCTEDFKCVDCGRSLK